jgi:hypothetical protein
VDLNYIYQVQHHGNLGKLIMSERWYPYPVIFGKIASNSDYPILQLRQFNGEQIALSSNNFNLLMNEYDFEDNTYTISRFLTLVDRDEIMLPAPILHCRKCSETNNVPCLLIMNRNKTYDYSEIQNSTYETRLKALIINEKQIDLAMQSCSKLKWIIDLTETKHEKNFILNYFRWVFSCVLFHPYFSTETAFEMIGNAMRDSEEAAQYGSKEIGDKEWNFWVRTNFLRKLKMPMPLPQVLINLIPIYKLPVGHPDKLFYKENISRADFGMFIRKEKHIVEIDGPSHYKDELTYVRNLVVDRSLKRNDWKVHRFGNSEIIEGSSEIDFILDELSIFDYHMI